ncbi:MAG: hypothetical protein CTY20_10935 [Hyphomicrobium sp.]|nr:MAG: hypothetical protein CTY20_10935 [Hyphomicrobium sp.]
MGCRNPWAREIDLDLFLDILFKVTLPIVALVALGTVLQPRLKLDVPGLNRLQVFVVLPCFLLHYLSSAKQPIAALLPTIGFSLLQFAVLILIGWLAAIVFRVGPTLRPVMALATMYANIGFFGIPVVQLAFPPEYILHQSVMTSLISIVIVTVGVWLLAPAERGGGPFLRLRQAFETPVIPAVAAGLLLRGFEVTLPPVIGMPVQMMGSIFTPLALFTLGCQLAAGARGEWKFGPLALIMVLKLLVAPAVTWALAIAVGLPDDLTDLFVVAAAAPVGVLLAVFCAEFNREPRFLASAILVTTLVSPLVVTAWLLLVRMM